MSHVSHKAVVTIACLAAALVAGCTTTTASVSQSGAPTSTGPSTSTGTALQSASLDDGLACKAGMAKSALNFGAASDPSTGLDPLSAQGPSSQLEAVYDTLMQFDYTKNAYEPEAASSLASNPAHTVWTLTLNPNVRFGNGDPLTASDVKDNIARFQNPKAPNAFSEQVALIKTMSVQGPDKLVFTLSEPWGSFPYLLTQNPGMIVNPAALAQYGEKRIDTLPPAAAGVGPFVAASFTAGQQMTVTAKSSWWGGPICLSSVTFTLIVDGQTAYQTFQAGQIQAFQTFTSNVEMEVQNAGIRQVVQPVPIISPALIHIAAGGALASLDLRKAMQYSQDLQLINQRIYDGAGVATASLIVPGSPDAPTVKPLGYDLTAAKTAAAAFEKAYPGTTLTYLNNAAALQENLALLQTSFWKTAGLTVSHSNVTQDQLVQQVYVNRNYQAVQWGIEPDPACIWCSLTSFATGDPANLSGYSNPGMDAALTQLRAASTTAQTQTAMNAVQTVWNETVPEPLAGTLLYTVAMNSKLHGLQYNTGDVILFNQAYLG